MPLHRWVPAPSSHGCRPLVTPPKLRPVENTQTPETLQAERALGNRGEPRRQGFDLAASTRQRSLLQRPGPRWLALQATFDDLAHGNFDRLERFSSRIEAFCGARKARHWSIHSLSTLPERRFNLIEDTASQMPGAVARSRWGRTRLFLFEWACNLCVSILYAVIVMMFLISGVVAKVWATSMHKAKSEDWPPMLEIPSCDRGKRITGRADSRGPGTLDLRGLARAAMSFLKRDRSFTTIDFNWLDAVRGREVPTRLYLPSAAKPLGSLPLIVFSHGLGGSRNDYQYLGRFWASRGWASLHVQHVGSDRSLFCGNPFTVVRRALASVTEREALDRVADLRFALDAIQRSGLAEFLDDDRIVVAGHSFGANTALLAVGASVTRYQDIVVTHDARFKAALLISAPQFYGEADLVAVLAEVSVPTLHVTSTGDLINIPGFVSSAHDRLAVFESVPDCRKTLVTYEGGTHSMFSDLKFTGGRKFNRQVKIATQELSIAFLSQAFEHDNFSIATWTRKWNSLLSLNFPVLNSAVG